MHNVLTQLQELDFVIALWGFTGVFILHELEEWNIVGWYHRNFVNLPPITARSTRLWIGFITVVTVAWCTTATVSGDPVHAAWVFFPAIALALQNALQHVYWQFYFRQYAPGVITAVGCLIPVCVGLIAWALIERYIPIWYIAICFVLILPGLIQTVQAENQMTPFIRSINMLGIKLEMMLS